MKNNTPSRIREFLNREFISDETIQRNKYRIVVGGLLFLVAAYILSLFLP